MKAFRNLCGIVTVAAASQFNGTALACAACSGQSDSAMAHGMNAGVLFLLGVIGTVLAGAASFFVFLARRSAAVVKAEQKSKS